MRTFLHEQWRAIGKQTLRDQVPDRIVPSWINLLLSWCISILQMQALSLLPFPLQCQLQTLVAQMQYHKIKPRRLVYVDPQKHDRGKIEGERELSSRQRQLRLSGLSKAPISASQTCCVKSGWRVSGGECEKRENANKWSWGAAVHCSLSLPVMNRVGKLVPDGPQALSLSSVRWVCHDNGRIPVHWTALQVACRRWHSVKRALCDEALLYDGLYTAGLPSSLLCPCMAGCLVRLRVPFQCPDTFSCRLRWMMVRGIC